MISVCGWLRECRKVAPGRALAACALAASLGGCSMSIPGFIDPQTTGSIRPKTYPFATEDWTAAEPALSSAMRAQENAEPTPWANAATGRRGDTIAVGAPYKLEGALCRVFMARIEEHGATRRYQATGCEKAGKDISISDAAPFKGL